MKKQRWRKTKSKKCCVCKKRIDESIPYGNLNNLKFYCWNCLGLENNE